jgi:hypothetical protein
MENKKVIIGGLAGGIAFFLLGWLFYGLLLKSYFVAHVRPGIFNEVPDFLWLLAGNLAMGFIFAIVIGKWSNTTSAGAGMQKGFMMGLLISAGNYLILHATSNIMNLHETAGYVGAITIMSTIVGALIAMIGGGKKA